MPIIVPIEENKVGLASATDAKFRAPDYSGSGLEALGAGLTDVGKGGAQLAETLDGLRTHRDDAAIKQAYVGFGNQADPLLHSYFSLNGSAARAALPQVEADLPRDRVKTPVDRARYALEVLREFQNRPRK